MEDIKKNNHKTLILFILISIGGLLARLTGINNIGGDMIECLIPWYNSMPAHQGIGVLRNYTGNYGLPYATILWLLHYIPGEAYVKIKVVSIIFEYISAYTVGAISGLFFDETKKKNAFLVSYAITLFYPPLILNGAFWGQCDGIYCAFSLLSVYFLLKEKTAPAMIMFGIAFAFKFQSVFFLPFMILYYFRKRNFSATNALLVPLSVIFMYIPAMLAGYSPLTIVSKYAGQASEYTQMYMYYPNLWSYFWALADYDLFHIPVILWVITGYALLFAALLLKGRDITQKAWIGVLFFSSLFPVYFLPAMHERYSILAELAGIIYLVIRPKRFWVPAYLWATITWTIVQPFFMGRLPEHDKSAMGLLIALIVLLIFTIRDIFEENNVIHTTSPNIFICFLDRYGIYLASFTATLIYIYSGIRISGFNNVTIVEIITTVCASMIWSVLSVNHISQSTRIYADITSLIKSGIVAITYLMLPTSILYSVLEKKPYSLCLIICALALIEYRSYLRKNAVFHLMITGFLFGISGYFSLAYLLFAIITVILFRDNKNIGMSLKVIIPIMTGTTICLLFVSYWINGFQHVPSDFWKELFISQGAFMSIISAILLSLCLKDRKFIFSLMIVQFAALMDFGRYRGIIKIGNYKYLYMLEAMAIFSILLLLAQTFIQRKSQGRK